MISAFPASKKKRTSMHEAALTHEFEVPGASTNASWSGIIALGVGAFALVTSEFLPVGLLPQIAQDVGVTPGQAGFVVTVPAVAAAASAPLTIVFAGRIDRRKLLSGFLGMVCLSNGLVSLSAGFVTLLLARVLMGVALGGFWTVGGSLGPRLRSGAQGAQATAIILSGISLGTVAGVPAGALLGAHLGWRAPFLLTAALGGVVVAALLALLPPVVLQRGSGTSALPEVLSRPRARLALVATILLFGGQFSAYTYITPYLEGSVHIGTSALSVVLLGYGAAGFVGNLFGGWIASRGERAAVVATALWLTGAIALLVTVGTSVWTAGPCVALWGFGFGMLPVTLQLFMLSSAPDHLESAAAILVSSVQISVGVGSLLGGLAADRFGFVTAFWLGAGAALLAAVTLGLVPTGGSQTSTLRTAVSHLNRKAKPS